MGLFRPQHLGQHRPGEVLEARVVLGHQRVARDSLKHLAGVEKDKTLNIVLNASRAEAIRGEFNLCIVCSIEENIPAIEKGGDGERRCIAEAPRPRNTKLPGVSIAAAQRPGQHGVLRQTPLKIVLTSRERPIGQAREQDEPA